MDTSFYTAATAAKSQQEKINVISNNLANINTNGYKNKNAVFSELMYYNLKNRPEVRTDLEAGVGVSVDRTDTDFTPELLNATGLPYQFGISGEGFFRLQDPVTQEITYTRNGEFSLSDRGGAFYLVTDANKLVLDETGAPIQLEETEKEGVTQQALSGTPGVYVFDIQNGLQSVGSNEFVPVEGKHAEPKLSETAVVREGYLEKSNVDLADEMAKTIESSRAYAYALKMVQTADEVEQTINNLRT